MNSNPSFFANSTRAASVACIMLPISAILEPLLNRFSRHPVILGDRHWKQVYSRQTQHSLTMDVGMMMSNALQNRAFPVLVGTRTISLTRLAPLLISSIWVT